MTKIAFRCGMCLHFNQHAHPAKEQVCSKLGIKSYNVAPRCFTPDVTKLISGTEDLAAMASLFGTLSPQQKTIFMALMLTNRGGKRPFSIGQKLYFRAVGGDYVQNYMAGYVMGYTSTKEVILSGSPEARTRGRIYTAYLDASSVLTATQWQKKRLSLIKANRLIDPSHPLRKAKKIDFDYEPPTIDQAPKAWKDEHTPRVKSRGTRNNDEPQDMVVELYRQEENKGR